MAAFKKTLRWPISKVGIGVAVVLTIVFICFAVLTVAIASGLTFWQSYPEGVIHTAIVFVANLALAGNCVAWIVLTLRHPGFNLSVVEEVEQEPPLPTWTLLFAYPLCWIYIGVWSYILIIYGIKFGPEKQKQWLVSSFSGFAQDVFLNQPLNIVKKLAVDIAIFTLASLMFASITGPTTAAQTNLLGLQRGKSIKAARTIRRSNLS